MYFSSFTTSPPVPALKLPLDVKGLSHDEKEDFIEKLESKKFELKDHDDQHPDKKEVLELLSTLKQIDVSNKVDTDKTLRNQLEENFRVEKKQLKLSEFNRIVDLTAPKNERTPDITTAIWKQHQKTKGQDTACRKDVDAEHLRKFQKKMQRKPMTKEMVSDLHGRQKDICVKYDTHKQGLTQTVGKYDAKTYTGLSLY